MEEQLKEKRDLKQGWTNKFIGELEILLEKCFLMPKKKKEHFITKEKLEVEFLRLLQSQTKQSALKDIKNDLSSIAIFDNKENIIGRIISIDIVNLEVRFENMYYKIETRSFEEVTFFNYKTLECVSMFDRQKLFCDKFTYRDTCRFLMSNIVKVEEVKKIDYYTFSRTNTHIKANVNHER